MTIEEIKARLDRYEWNDVEFKTARRDVLREVGDSLGSSASDQVEAPTASLVTEESDQAKSLTSEKFIDSTNNPQKAILRFCYIPQPQEAIMRKIGVTHRSHFRNRQLRPLLDAGLLRQTHPEKQTHPQQAYVVTESTIDLLAILAEPDLPES